MGKGTPSRAGNYSRQLLPLTVVPLESCSLRMAVLQLSLLQNYFKISWLIWAVREPGGFAQGAPSECDALTPSSHQASQSDHPLYLQLHVPAPFLVLIGIYERSWAKELNWQRKTTAKRLILYQFRPLDPKEETYLP